VGGKEAGWRKNGRGPPQAELFGDERRGIDEFAGDHKICVACGREQVGICVFKVRKNEFSKQNFGAAADVLALGNEVSAGWVPIGPEGYESDAALLNLGAIKRRGGDGDGVASTFEFEGQGEAGMEVAERADGGEQNALGHSCGVHGVLDLGWLGRPQLKRRPMMPLTIQ
jgi:hypothetical protein